MTFDIAVVGSANLDIVVPVPHHPVTGETVLGGDHELIPGGKGANQAVAAARLGRRVAMIGRVGGDDAGQTLRASLEADGVDTTHLGADPEAPSGIALIGVDGDGDNAIIVSPGANARVGIDDIDRAAAALDEAKVVMVQLEVPVAAITAAAQRAQGMVILNPAPAPTTPLPSELIAAANVIVPNRIELAQLAEAPVPETLDEVAAMAGDLGVATVVVTLGADGAAVIEDGSVTSVPAPVIDPVDTTGAGDSFCGAFADAICRGLSTTDAARWAVAAGAVTATRPGAQPSLPTAADVDAMLR